MAIDKLSGLPFRGVRPIPVIPTEYTDALSYGEQLGIIGAKCDEAVEKVNEVVDDNNEFKTELTEQQTTFEDEITEQQTAFEGDMTDWKNGVDDDLSEWKTTTEGDISDWEDGVEGGLETWKTSTKGEFQTQIDEMEDEWDNFVNEYAQDYGITGVTGDSELLVTNQKLVTDLAKNVGNADKVTITSWTSGKVLMPDGRINTVANENFEVSNVILFDRLKYDRLVLTSTNIHNTTGYNIVSFYNGNTQGSNRFVGGVKFNELTKYIDIPANATAMVFGSNTTNLGNKTDYNGDFYLVKYDSNDILSHIDDVMSNRQITPSFTNDGKFISPKGVITSASNFSYSEPIPIGKNDVMITSSYANLAMNGAIAMFAFYDSDTFDEYHCLGTVLNNDVNEKFTIPLGTKYMLVGNNCIGGNTYTYEGNLFITSINNRISNGVEIKCADEYPLIVGDTFEMFYKGILDTPNSENYTVVVNGDIGYNRERKYRVTPTTSGTYTLQLECYDDKKCLQSSKNVDLVVNSAPSFSVEKTVLCVGDSLTVHGEWVNEFKRRMTGTGGSPSGYGCSLNFIGTCEVDGTHFEGYGGYNWQTYNTAATSGVYKQISCTHDKTSADQHSLYRAENGSVWSLETINANNIIIVRQSGDVGIATSGTLTWISGGEHHNDISYTNATNVSSNPFWDSNANKVDFATYASSIGVTTIDYVVCLLGWNCIGWEKSKIKTQAEVFIGNVKASFPNAKIMLVGIEIPSFTGCGHNYAINDTRFNDYIRLIKFVHDVDDVYADIAENTANVSAINLSAQFDSEYNLPREQEVANTRSTVQVTVETNGIHPAESGYMQIADAVTRGFVNQL